MRVSQALDSRITCRAFLDTPVPAATVRSLLAGASRAPSGGNVQPWHVWALSGEPLARLTSSVKSKIAGGAFSDGPTEYLIYPPAMKEPYQARKFKVGADMYATIGVAYNDGPGGFEQFVRNFEFFGAPVGLFFALDRSMQQGQWADMGMFLQSFMLLAREQGLHTAPLESWSLWHKTVRAFVEMPDELMLFCGMGLGHMDEAHPINRLRAERAPVDAFARLIGF